MAKVQPAFTAKFRILDNQNPVNDYAPEKNVIFDFTSENALKAAEFFMKMHDKAEKEKAAPSKRQANVQHKQNIAVLARDAIVKSTTDEQLDQHFNTLVARLDEGKISQDQYNKLIDLIKARRKALTP